MIVFGHSTSVLKTALVPDKCTACGLDNCIKIEVQQEYVHIYWMPFFPTAKIGKAQCMHCRQVWESHQIQFGLRDTYDAIAARVKTPIWSFAGAAALAGIITIGVIISNFEDKNTKLYLDSPQNGDIYHYETEER
jgi:hypothetical protein